MGRAPAVTRRHTANRAIAISNGSANSPTGKESRPEAAFRIPSDCSDVTIVRPEPGAGVNVDPLGEVLIEVFPDGFRALFAPAAALPASLLMPVVEPVVELPVVVLLTDGSRGGAARGRSAGRRAATGGTGAGLCDSQCARQCQCCGQSNSSEFHGVFPFQVRKENGCDSDMFPVPGSTGCDEIYPSR